MLLEVQQGEAEFHAFRRVERVCGSVEEGLPLKPRFVQVGRDLNTSIHASSKGSSMLTMGQ